MDIRTYTNKEKCFARGLRKKGLSYSEIQKETSTPKSTLAYWLKGVKLTGRGILRLKQLRTEAVRRGLKKKIWQTAELKKEIRSSARASIKKISDRELWLMGIMLYWREGALNKKESDIKKGVEFSSADPFLINFFLKWLKDVGRLENDEICFDIFIRKSKKNSKKKIIAYWSRVTQSSRKKFSRIYFQNVKLKKRQRKTNRKTKFGFLKIKVKASSMLARQIAGWIEGIKFYYHLGD